MAGPGTTLDADRAGVERLAVWLAVVAVLAGLVAAMWIPGWYEPGATPGATLSVSYDDASGTVTVTHESGDSIRDRTTERIVVVVADAETDATASVTWAGDPGGALDRKTGFPIGPGETLPVDDATVDADGDGNRFDADRTVGIALSAGDEVRVVWHPSDHADASEPVALANATLG